MSRHDPTTLAGVLRWILQDPLHAVGLRWNYKSAVLSSVTRALLFFGANVSAGPDAALSAMTTEFCFRFMTAGFYGALTQAFRRVEPSGAGMLGALVLLPLIAHSLEAVVHWWRGTVELATSLAVSVGFTVLSTTFNLFAMRRGALIVGEERQSLLADLQAMPRLVFLFVAAAVRGGARAWR